MQEKSVNINGVNIYSLLNPNLRSFCLCLYIRAGSIFETPADNGISHLFEHVVFRNVKSKYKNFYEELALRGIDMQGTTYKEFIQIEINGPAYGFAFAVEVLCHFFDEIEISKTELLKEKNRIKAEIREEGEPYMKFYGLTLIEGEMLSQTSPETEIVLNEAAVKALGWHKAVGKHIYYSNEKFRVIGVVKNWHITSPTMPILPTGFQYNKYLYIFPAKV